MVSKVATTRSWVYLVPLILSKTLLHVHNTAATVGAGGLLLLGYVRLNSVELEEHGFDFNIIVLSEIAYLAL